MSRYIMTISCKDTKGIVAAVSGLLSENDYFINESAQFGDVITHQFFMRLVFESLASASDISVLEARFYEVARRFSMEWHIHDLAYKPRVVMLVSKQNHCLNDLLHRYANGALPIVIPAVISNHRDVEKMVAWHGIPFHYLPVTPDTKMEQEMALWKLIQNLEVDLVVLARYMQVLTPSLVAKLHGKAINIHHSFLPSFKGAKPYHQAHQRGVKLIGATAHFVTNDLDEGPIIEQEVIRVDHTHTVEQFVTLGEDIESRVLSRAVKYFIEHRVLMNGNKTVVFR